MTNFHDSKYNFHEIHHDKHVHWYSLRFSTMHNLRVCPFHSLIMEQVEWPGPVTKLGHTKKKQNRWLGDRSFGSTSFRRWNGVGIGIILDRNWQRLESQGTDRELMVTSVTDGVALFLIEGIHGLPRHISFHYPIVKQAHAEWVINNFMCNSTHRKAPNHVPIVHMLTQYNYNIVHPVLQVQFLLRRSFAS